MASNVSVSPTGTSAAAACQFPPIDPKDSAERFFKLIRAGKWQDAETLAKDDSTKQGLLEVCKNPSFAGQIVAEEQMERLLAEVDNKARLDMANRIALILKSYERETPFAQMVEAIVHLQSRNDHSIYFIPPLVPHLKFVKELATYYKTVNPKKGDLETLFENLFVKVKAQALKSLEDSKLNQTRYTTKV